MHKDRRSHFLFLVGYTASFAIGSMIAFAMSNLLGAYLLAAIAVVLASGSRSFYRRHKLPGARVWRRAERPSSELLDDLNAAAQWTGFEAREHEEKPLLPAETFAWNSFVATTGNLTEL